MQTNKHIWVEHSNHLKHNDRCRPTSNVMGFCLLVSRIWRRRGTISSQTMEKALGVNVKMCRLALREHRNEGEWYGIA